MNAFHRVSLAKKVFRRDFKETVKKVNHVTFTRTTIATLGTMPLKIYHCNGDDYVYCSDKTVRKISGNNYTTLSFTSNEVPLVLPVIVSGVKKVLFVGDGGAKIDDAAVTGIPFGSAGTVMAGRVFIADGNRLKYSQEFNFTDFSNGLGSEGFIEFDKDEGDIVYVSEVNGKLYVLTEHAVFTVTPYGEPYEFVKEKISDFGVNVVQSTAFSAGGRIGFISGKRFYVIKSGKVELVSDSLSDFATVTFGHAGGENGVYYLGFTVGSANYVFAYDFASDTEIIEPTGVFRVISGYSQMRGDIRFYRNSITCAEETVTEEYSGEYDFGSCAKKAVCNVEAHISGNCLITVTGEGSYSATLTEKCNYLSCFVHGRSFSIAFSQKSEDFKLYRLTVRYVIYGE